jgi:hypothetical protein
VWHYRAVQPAEDGEAGNADEDVEENMGVDTSDVNIEIEGGE